MSTILQALSCRDARDLDGARLGFLSLACADQRDDILRQHPLREDALDGLRAAGQPPRTVTRIVPLSFFLLFLGGGLRLLVGLWLWDEFQTRSDDGAGVGSVGQAGHHLELIESGWCRRRILEDRQAGTDVGGATVPAACGQPECDHHRDGKGPLHQDSGELSA